METAVQKTAQMLLPGIDEKQIAPNPKETQNQPQEIHPLLDAITKIDPNSLTPLEALNLLIDWKRRWGENIQTSKDQKGKAKRQKA